MALTEEGILYLERARMLLAAHAEFESAVPGDAEPRGILRVTAPVNFGREHLMPLLVALLEKYPQLDARVLLLDRTVSMVDERLDAGVRLGKLPDSSLRVTRAGTVKRAVYASSSYIERYGVPAKPSDLSRHHTISSGSHSPFPERWSLGGEDAVLRIAVKPRLVVNNSDAAAEAAAAGLGLASLLSYQAAQTRCRRTAD